MVLLGDRGNTGSNFLFLKRVFGPGKKTTFQRGDQQVGQGKWEGRAGRQQTASSLEVIERKFRCL